MTRDAESTFTVEDVGLRPVILSPSYEWYWTPDHDPLTPESVAVLLSRAFRAGMAAQIDKIKAHMEEL